MANEIRQIPEARKPRRVRDDTTLGCVKTLLHYCQQNPDWFGKYEGSLLALKEDLVLAVKPEN